MVTNEDLNCPIIGYNVIELFVKDNGPETALPAVAESFDNVSNAEASALVNFMNSPVATVYDSYNNLVVVRSVLLFCGFILT